MRGAGRALAVIAALVLAGVAVYAITAYVRGIEQRAFEDAELVEVLIAQGEIPEGVTAEAAREAGLIEGGTIPSRNVPLGAVTAFDQLEGRLTLDRILQNEVLVLGRWGSPDDADVRELAIPEGFQAISVQVGIPPGVAGFIRPGDEVSLIVTTDSTEVEQVDEEDTDGDEGQVITTEGEIRSQYLLQNIIVLTAGQRVITEEGAEDVREDGGSVLLTLALEAEDAERVVFAIETASLYFTLLPSDAEPVETPGRSLDTLFDE